ncbi:hypothetical protein T439DRAFT_302039 [Meredithblackwellia eburnea MCA 4105]
MTTTPRPVELCEDCTTGGLIPGSPKGSEGTLGGVKFYSSPSQPSEKAIVIATDGFGLGTDNIRLVADSLSEALEITVFVPDVLEGDHVPGDKLVKIDSPLGPRPLYTKVWLILTMIASFMWYVGPRWASRHGADKTVPLMVQFCEALRKERHVSRLGMVGFCMGGQITTLLAASTPDESGVDLISVFIAAHPSSLKVSDFAAIRHPFALICAEEDMLFDSIKEGAIAELQTLKTGDGSPLATKVFDDHPGTTHGFACRPDMRDDKNREAFTRAQSQIQSWFRQQL